MDGKNSMISYSAIFSRLNGSCRMMLSISALLCLISMTASTLPSEDGGGRLHGGAAQVWIRRPPPNDQFSQVVSLKQIITFSGLNPDCESVLMSCSSSFFLTLTLLPADHRISMSTKSLFRSD